MLFSEDILKEFVINWFTIIVNTGLSKIAVSGSPQEHSIATNLKLGFHV